MAGLGTEDSQHSIDNEQSPRQKEASESQRLSAIARISRALNTTLNLEQILETILEEALNCTGAVGGAITLRSDSAAIALPSVQRGFVMALPSLEWQAVAAGQAVVFQELPKEGDGPLPEGSPGAALLAPITFLDSVAGFIRLHFEAAQDLSEETTAFMAALANHAAIAVGNLQRYQELTNRNNELHRRTQQIERMVEASRVFHGDSALTVVYEDLVYAIQEVTGFNIVVLSLAEGYGGKWTLRAATGAGLPLEQMQHLGETPVSWDRMAGLIQSTFALGNAYFVPQESPHAPTDIVRQLGAELYLPRRQPGEEEWRADDLFFIPLYNSAGEPLGLISLAAPQDNKRPDRSAARILEVFANQAATSIENVQLFHNTREYAKQLQHLQEVSQAILLERDDEQRLHLLVEGLRAAGWQRAALTLRDENFETTKLVTAGLTLREQTYLLENMLPAAVWRQRFADPAFQKFREGSCYFVPAEDPLAEEHIGFMLADHATTGDEPGAWRPHDMLCTPIYDRHSRPIALIGLDQPVNGRRPDQQMLRLIELFSRFTAASIENMNLVAELRALNADLDARVEQRTHQLADESERVKILLRISTELTASLDKDRVLNRALLLINEVIGATQGNILLLEETTGDLLFQAAIDQQRDIPRLHSKSSVSSNEGLAGWVIQNKQATIVHDTLADERWVFREGTSRHHRSAIAVPLVFGEEIPGVLMLFHHAPDFFSDAQLELATAAGIQVAQAVYNAELYDLIRQQAESLGTMMRGAQVEVAKTHAILESIGEGVLVTQEGSEISLINEAACFMLRVTRDDLQRKPIAILRERLGASENEWLDALEELAFQTTRSDRIENHVSQIRVDGRYLNVTLSPVLAGRRIMGTVSVFRNVTREVEVDRMKSEFVSTVSHELRTPMTSVKGYADLLLMGATGPLTDTQNHYLQVIKTNADRLGLLVDDLLDISRIETGETELFLQPVDMRLIIRSVTAQHLPGRLQSLQKDIDVVLAIPHELPPVLADVEKATRILTNLLDNAVNYTPDGGRIEVSCRADAGFVRTTVRDSGIGISEENLPRIFDRFFRADHEHIQGISGTGLGLSIVQGLVIMQGGSVEVQSTPGEGSAFTIALPMAIRGERGKAETVG